MIIRSVIIVDVIVKLRVSKRPIGVPQHANLEMDDPIGDMRDRVVQEEAQKSKWLKEEAKSIIHSLDWKGEEMFLVNCLLTESRLLALLPSSSASKQMAW